MSKQPERASIDELIRKLSELIERKQRLDDEAAEWAKKRNGLNERLKTMRGEIRELRFERDEMNENVKALKQRRNEQTSQKQLKTAEIRTLRQEREVLAKDSPRRDRESLEKEIEETEWKIQTSSLSLEEDKQLVGKVKELEEQLVVYRKVDRLDQKMSKVRSDIGVFGGESEKCHQQLTQLTQQSQKIHARAVERIAQAKEVKTEADKFHGEFLEAMKQAKPLQEEISALSDKIRQLKGQIRVSQEEKRKQDEDMLRERLEKQALEKLKRGEKLTWEEFQILAAKGIIAQD